MILFNYRKLEDLNGTIVQKLELLNEQKLTTIEMFRLGVRKVLDDREMNDTFKKYNI